MKNEIEWKLIYRKENLIHYRGHAEETWEAEYISGFLVRHVRYDLNEGDESNYVQTIIFVENN